MKYTVLSPFAKSDYLEKNPINPRLDTLDGKTIGLFAAFKEYHPYVCMELERQLAAQYPNTKFSHYVYKLDTTELCHDAVNYEPFRAWLGGVDAVVGVGADFGSCALFMGYNHAEMERLGKPAVILAKDLYESSARRGAASRGYPGLRVLPYDGPNFVPVGVDCGEWTQQVYGAILAPMIDDIVNALTAPLTPEEAAPTAVKDWSNTTFTGTIEEINDYFYSMGWTNGAPVVPPTREAVDEMMKGTDLPADYVVAELPPMRGQATVEKIAINAVMAGCLPIYMPLLIALVECMADEVTKLEGWTCSMAPWAPAFVVNGPIRHIIGMETDKNLASPYTKPSFSIPKAFGYMLMNIAGVRSKIEDMGGPGNPDNFGFCIAENEEENPWWALPKDLGYEAGDNTITLFWPFERNAVHGDTPAEAFEVLLSLRHFGFDPGMMLTLTPQMAKMFADKGYSKQDILDYVKEYSRRPSVEVPRSAFGNNHWRRGMVYPAEGRVESCPVFWNTDHMFIVVGGRDIGIAYIGGGDHGGPVCKKAQLPANWDALVEKYGYRKPNYVTY